MFQISSLTPQQEDILALVFLRMPRILTKIYYPTHRNEFSTYKSYARSSVAANPSSSQSDLQYLRILADFCVH